MAAILYSLFEKIANRKYQQISNLAYPKQTAIRVFQNQLINGVFQGKHISLRPIKAVKENVNPQPLCDNCAKHLHTEHTENSVCECNCLLFKSKGAN